MLLFFESFYKTFFNLLPFAVICFIVPYNDYKYIAVHETRCAEKLNDILYHICTGIITNRKTDELPV